MALDLSDSGVVSIGWKGSYFGFSPASWPVAVFAAQEMIASRFCVKLELGVLVAGVNVGWVVCAGAVPPVKLVRDCPPNFAAPPEAELEEVLLVVAAGAAVD